MCGATEFLSSWKFVPSKIHILARFCQLLDLPNLKNQGFMKVLNVYCSRKHSLRVLVISATRIIKHSILHILFIFFLYAPPKIRMCHLSRFASSAAWLIKHNVFMRFQVKNVNSIIRFCRPRRGPGHPDWKNTMFLSNSCFSRELRKLKIDNSITERPSSPNRPEHPPAILTEKTQCF